LAGFETLAGARYSIGGSPLAGARYQRRVSSLVIATSRGFRPLLNRLPRCSSSAETVQRPKIDLASGGKDDLWPFGCVTRASDGTWPLAATSVRGGPDPGLATRPGPAPRPGPDPRDPARAARASA